MQDIINICAKLKKINKKAYCIWSFCISRILWVYHDSDIDLATDALPEEIEKVLNVVWNIWRKYWTLIVKEWNTKIEITTFRKDIWSINQRRPVNVTFTDDIKEDAGRRDFTINAIYYDPLEGIYIDPFWWIPDLSNKIIRFVWDINKRLDEDVLRLLRFVRFKSKFNLKYADNNYSKIIKSRTTELKNISVERIKSELDKILVWKYNIKWLKYLKSIWFFKHFMPEVEKLIEAPWWPKHHLEWNVWIHTLLVIKELNKETEIDDIDLYWASLLHDIGKFNTVSFDDKWNVHYYNHDKIWAKMFVNIAKRLKFSKESTDKIFFLIDNHIKIWDLFEMKKYKAYRFIMKKYFQELLILCKCDSLGKNPRNQNFYKKAERFFHEWSKKLQQLDLITWNEIMIKYPKLKWNDIGKKIEEENNKILNNL